MYNQNPKPSKTKIFNPLSTDFTVNFDSKPYTIHAQEIEEFDTPIAEHIKEHLAKEIVFRNGWAGSNYEDKKKEVEKEISVNL